MKLSNFLGLALCFALTSCGGGGGDTLDRNQQGLYVGNPEFNQTIAIEDQGENRASSTTLAAECESLKSLSNSGTLARTDLIKLEADGTVRSVYFNQFGLFDPTLERIEVDQNLYVLGRIVDVGESWKFENTQPAFGKVSISNPDEESVITANSAIQRTDVAFFTSNTSSVYDSVDFTTETVGAFGVEDRTSFEYKKVTEDELYEMTETIRRYCLNR